MPTYKKPGALVQTSRTYGVNDFDMESGITKKVNCLTAFAIVALIVALAALSIALMLLFQAFPTKDMETSSIAALQTRIRQLEHKVGINSSLEKVTLREEELPVDLNPLLTIEEDPPEPTDPKHTKTIDKRPDEYLKPTHEEHPDVAKEDTPVPPLEPDNDDETVTVIEHTQDDVSCEPQDSDDEDYLGSGDCPVFPRPTCPSGYRICNKGTVCPIPVCHKPENQP